MRSMWLRISIAVVLLLAGTAARATVFGNVRGVVHDPQHRPVANASVQVKSVNSDWSQTAQTSDDGEFSVSAVPFGDYAVIVTASGFSATKQFITLASDTSPVLHFML